MKVTPFPVPGSNFRDMHGQIRGVTKVTVTRNEDIQVDYIEGQSEVYASQDIPSSVDFMNRGG